MNYDTELEKMKSYIKVKGVSQIGPLIQYTHPLINSDGQVEVEIYLILQCNQYIYNVESPYTMESVLRVPNCMYCRYIGPQEKLRLAYDKINVEAFETDEQLLGSSYAVFVANNEDDETIIADVFMPRKID